MSIVQSWLKISDVNTSKISKTKKNLFLISIDNFVMGIKQDLVLISFVKFYKWKRNLNQWVHKPKEISFKKPVAQGTKEHQQRIFCSNQHIQSEINPFIFQSTIREMTAILLARSSMQQQELQDAVWWVPWWSIGPLCEPSQQKLVPFTTKELCFPTYQDEVLKPALPM